MKIFYCIKLLMTAAYLSSIECDNINLHKIIETKDFYQTTLFISEDIVKYLACTPDLKMFSPSENPVSTLSFPENRNYSGNLRDSNYALQESLVVFYTIDVNEIKSFIDFLVLQVPIVKRPKCLVTFMARNFTIRDEINVSDALKYAWEKKFLDFTILVLSSEQETVSLVYDFNPFNDVVYTKELENAVVDIFPDKLRNGFGYALYTSNFTQARIVLVRRPNWKAKISTSVYYNINFAARILNFNIKKKNVSSVPSFPPDFLEKSNFDVLDIQLVTGVSYQTYFLIPSDDFYRSIVAFVPILHIPGTHIFFKMFVNIMIFFGIFCIFLYVFRFFNVTFGSIGVFDFVRLFFGQSIAHEPVKTFHRIIFFTIIIATVKITNEFLMDILVIEYEKEEVPFESYEELYNSKLQSYTNIPYFRAIANIIDDPYFSKLINNTILTESLIDCFFTLKKSKNVSCISLPHSAEWLISALRDFDGSPTMKVANLPIFTQPSGFYWFAAGSPFAKKFLEIMRRVKEGNLMHWPTLVHENLWFFDVEGTDATVSGGIESAHLLATLTFCYIVSAIALIIEWNTSKAELKNRSNIFLVAHTN